MLKLVLTFNYNVYLYISLNTSRYRELTFIVTCMQIIAQLEFNVNSLPPEWGQGDYIQKMQ